MFKQNKDIKNLRKDIKRVVLSGVLTKTQTIELMTKSLSYVVNYSNHDKINNSKLHIPSKKKFDKPIDDLERLEKRFSSKKDGGNLAYNVYRMLNTIICVNNSTDLASKCAMCDYIDKIDTITSIKELRTVIIGIRKSLILHVNDKLKYNHIITDVYDNMPTRGNHEAIMLYRVVMRNLIKGSFESGNYGETFSLINKIMKKTSCIN